MQRGGTVSFSTCRVTPRNRPRRSRPDTRYRCVASRTNHGHVVLKWLVEEGSNVKETEWATGTVVVSSIYQAAGFLNLLDYLSAKVFTGYGRAAGRGLPSIRRALETRAISHFQRSNVVGVVPNGWVW